MDANLVKIPKFLKRLWREVNDPSNPDIVWSEDGEHIRIPDKESFVKETLPKLSRTKEYSAFIRQLNIYGFMKMRNDNIEEYKNPFFVRDQPALMGLIKRIKRYKKIDAGLQLPSIERNISFLTESNYRLSREVGELRERLENQGRTIDGILDIFGRVFRNGVQNYTKQERSSSGGFAEPFLGSFVERQSAAAKQLESLSSSISAREKTMKESEEVEDKKRDMFSDMNGIFF